MRQTMRLLIKLLTSIILIIATIWFVTTQPLFIHPDKHTTPAIQVSASQLQDTVRTLSSGTMGLPARLGEEASLLPTVNWLEQKLSQYGKPYRQAYKVGDQTFYNLLIDFGP